MSPRSCVKTAFLPLLTTALWLSPSAHAIDVAMCTDVGNITISLDEENAPLHTANFLEYVDRGHYSGSVFHRVIAGFMIQGGGYDRQLREKATLGPIENESRNGLSNVRGTIAAARTADPHSATAQFFINLVNNDRLDGTSRDWGYSVFGTVTAGMESVDEIAGLPTRSAGQFGSDVPDPLISVLSMARVDLAVLDSLPAEGRNEAILERVSMAVERNDMESALQWLTHFRATCTPMDPESLLTEARVAASLERFPRAQSALDEYFSLAPDTHEAYEEAIALYESVAPGAAPNIAMRIGRCVAPTAPEVPDGTLAELEDMLEGQARVQTFMSDSTVYLECLDDFIDNQRNDEAARESALNEYNRMVGVTQQLGDDFNEQVRAFRAR